MFRMGTTVLTPEAAELIGVIADAVAPDQGELTIRGHTDSLPYKAGTSGNNWSLSAGRAEATRQALRSEEHTSELQSLMRISYAVFCLKKQKTTTYSQTHQHNTTQT